MIDFNQTCSRPAFFKICAAAFASLFLGSHLKPSQSDPSQDAAKPGCFGSGGGQPWCENCSFQSTCG